MIPKSREGSRTIEAEQLAQLAAEAISDKKGMDVLLLEVGEFLAITDIFVIATGTVALVAWLHNPTTALRRVYGVLTAVTALSGAGFAIRQLWLQSLPEDQVPACGPPAGYLMDSFSPAQWLPILLRGDGNCAKVDWTFLGLSIAGWMLIIFVALATFALWQGFRRPPVI